MFISSDAFKGCLGLVLVGPYDVVAGRQPRDISTPVSYLTHYRYCFDPPEFLTVVKGCDKSQFHFGYYRCVSQKLLLFVAGNLIIFKQNSNKNGADEILQLLVNSVRSLQYVVQ